MLHERGALQLWLAAGDVPDYALYTATWALIAPKLPELFPGECMYPQSCIETHPEREHSVEVGVLSYNTCNRQQSSINWKSPRKGLLQAAKQWF